MGCGCPSTHPVILNAKRRLSESLSLASPDCARSPDIQDETIFPQYNRFTRRSEVVSYFERDPGRPGCNRLMRKGKERMSVCLTATDATEREMTLQGKSLRLEYVYGRSGFGEVSYTGNSDVVVYTCGAVLILLSKSTNSQSFLSAGDLTDSMGHSDQIQATALSLKRDFLATGDIGRNPLICIWQLFSKSLPIASFYQGEGSIGVWKLAFSGDSRYVIAVDLAKEQKVRIYAWQASPPLLYTYSCIKGCIVDCAWSLTSDLFCTVNPVIFWTKDANGYIRNSGKFDGTVTEMTTVGWLSTGNCLTGGQNGQIYVWNDYKALKHTQILPENVPIFTLRVVHDTVIVGGDTYSIYILDAALQKIKELEVPSSPISLDWSDGTVLCGSKDGVIQELCEHMRVVLMESHVEGEVWGLSGHPKERNLFVTTGDDNAIKVWDMVQRKCVSTGVLETNITPRRGGGLCPAQQSRAVSISPTGEVAVGYNDGHVTIRACYQRLNDIIAVIDDAQEWIQVLTYSPTGKYLSVGSHDNSVYIYTTHRRSYTLIHKLSGRYGPVAALDWSKDECYVKSCDVDGQVNIWYLATETQVEAIDSIVSDLDWWTWTAHSGWSVRGFHTPSESSDFVITANRSPDCRTIAVGNAWGLVELYPYPNGPDTCPLMYRAHSMEVVRVVWTDDGNTLLTAGGYDQGIMQWMLVKPNTHKGSMKETRFSYKSVR